MKKLIAALLVLSLLLALSCAGAETLAGGWSLTETLEIPDEARAAFDKAMEGLVGVSYEPLACLGYQIVAGTNYCILCRAMVVYPGARPYYALVYIYEDLTGNAEILDIQLLELGV